MPSSDERRKGLRANLALEFVFNVLASPEEYARGMASAVKRVASIDALFQVGKLQTDTQALLARIDQKLSLLLNLISDRSAHKNYLYQGMVQDISEFGLAFGHNMILENGTILEIGLKLNTNETKLMDICGRIVHVKEAPADTCGGFTHIYGVEFIDVLNKDQNEIVQWIFNHQREQIRRRRERL